MKFCLEHGVELIDLDQTVLMSIETEHDKEIESAIKSIVKYEGFESLAFDARFDRLINRLKAKNSFVCLMLLLRLIGRVKVHQKYSIEESADAALISSVLSEKSSTNQDRMLKDAGLI